MDESYLKQQQRMRRLHDLLARTPMADRFWLSGGALLGWAREGRLLTHDALDVDFHYLADDADRFAATLPILVDAGFRIYRRFPSVRPDVEAREWALREGDAHFDFFRIDDCGDHLRSYSWGWDQGRTIENELSLPRQPLEDFSFLGRRWLKPVDHDAELTALYGDWRTPDRNFKYMHSHAIVQRRPWDMGPGFEFSS